MLFAGSCVSEPSSCELVAHEDVVPVLEEAVGVVPGALVRPAERRPTVVGTSPSRGRRDRSAPPARSSRTAAGARSARRGSRALFQISIASSSGPSPSSSSPPNTVDPDPLLVEPEALARRARAPGDRLLLEVVAEAPVAEHLEEGEVAARVAHLLDVGRAEALLAPRSGGWRAAARRRGNTA